MKACPVCGAVAFDDAPVCYGCLHQYESKGVDAAGMPLLDKAPVPELPGGDGLHQAQVAAPFGVQGMGLPGGGGAAGDSPGPGSTFAVPLKVKEPRHAASVKADIPEFLIRFTPELNSTGELTWKCAVQA